MAETNMGEVTKPQRHTKLTLTIEVDNPDELGHELRSFADQWDREGPLTKGVMGGPTSSHIYEVRVDASMTHDRYFEAIKPFLIRSGKG